MTGARLLIVLLASFLPGGGDDETRSATEKLFEQRREERAHALAALEERYLGMKAWWAERIAESEGLETLARDVAAALVAARGERLGDLTAARGLRARREAARSWCADAVAGLDLEEGWRGVLPDLLAGPLLDLLPDADEATLEDAVARVLGPVFDGERPFAAIWNDHLFRNVPEARAYAAAHAAYLAAGRLLEREKAPDRFTEGGLRVPPGMVVVRGGTYPFGPHEGWERKGIGRKGRKIALPTFFIDRLEVTNADYLAFLQSLGEEERVRRTPRTWPKGGDGKRVFPKGREDHPVTGVSFDDAMAFAAWAGKRLPTEEEWEAAARGTEGLPYPWGPEYEPGRCNDREAGVGGTEPVGSRPQGASPVGCLDMAGNVEEWCATTVDGDPIVAPVASNLVQVVVRGGSFRVGADGVTTTFRWAASALSTRKDSLGFRCAKSP